MPVIAILPWGDVIEDFLDPIGLTVHDFASDMTGGWLFGYVEALRSAGWSAVVVAPSRSVNEPKRLVHAGTGAPIWLVPGRSSQQVRNPELRAVRQWLMTPVAAIRGVLEDAGVEVLLVQDYERPQFDRMLGLGRAMHLPVYATYQGGDRTLSRVERLVRRRSMQSAAGLIIAASAERERVAAAYAVSRVAAVPNPLDVEQWTALPRAEARAVLGLPEDKFIAVTHGRIDIHRKGLDVLLAAWSGPSELVLIGSGQDRGRLGTMVAGRSDVRWIDGYTNDRALIRRWLSAADVYISASRIEGMPVAPLEAMACGLPVIASDADGLRDILAADEATAAMLVPRDDVGALRRAIDSLCQDAELCRNLGRHSRALVETRYATAVVGQQLADFLDQRSAW